MSNSSAERPIPSNFDKFLPWVCKEYNVEVDIIITRVSQKPYVSTAAGALHKKLSKKLRTGKDPALIPSFSNSDSIFSLSPEKSVISHGTTVRVETIYDNDDNLVTLKFLKNKVIPRKIMQIIALTLPFQKYLTSIYINSGLRMDSIHEISNFLPNSQITELCFDGTFLDKANYYILLNHGKLKHLSLARCTINNDVVKTITDQLKETCPAARVLSALNLSNNKITDIGAKYIADMLRSNRKLAYLNLAGNMITDEGGVSILNTLQTFPMQTQEVVEGKGRYVAYLKERKDLIQTLIKELAASDASSNKRKSIKKGKLDSQSMQNISSKKRLTETGVEAQIIQEKAESLADTKLGLFNGPFCPNNTKTQDSIVYCLGNNALCCLNFAYNNLTYASVQKLREVLSTQQILDRTPRGLIKVVIEGNLLPVACKEYEEINHLLKSSVESLSKYEASMKKKPLSSKSR